MPRLRRVQQHVARVPFLVAHRRGHLRRVERAEVAAPGRVLRRGQQDDRARGHGRAGNRGARGVVARRGRGDDREEGVHDRLRVEREERVVPAFAGGWSRAEVVRVGRRARAALVVRERVDVRQVDVALRRRRDLRRVVEEEAGVLLGRARVRAPAVRDAVQLAAADLGRDADRVRARPDDRGAAARRHDRVVDGFGRAGRVVHEVRAGNVVLARRVSGGRDPLGVGRSAGVAGVREPVRAQDDAPGARAALLRVGVPGRPERRARALDRALRRRAARGREARVRAARVVLEAQVFLDRGDVARVVGDDRDLHVVVGPVGAPVRLDRVHRHVRERHETPVDLVPRLADDVRRQERLPGRLVRAPTRPRPE